MKRQQTGSRIVWAKRRVEYDMFYIENWSLLLDLRIILETIWRLIWENAY